MPRVVPSQVVALIDETIPAAKQQQMMEEQGGDLEQFGVSGAGQGAEIAALLALLDRLPDELLVLEPRDYARYVAAIEALRQVVHKARSEDRDLRLSLIKASAGSGLLNPVTVVRQMLSRCPEELPSPATASLAFVSDHDLREALRLDISSVNQALANGEWKAATVLAGSVIEALLLWALQQPAHVAKVDGSTAGVNLLKAAKRYGCTATVPSGALEYGELSYYLDIAQEITGVLKPDTLRQAAVARTFRNLIHPGRVQRLAQKCDRGTALAAVGALEHVVRDLTPP